MFLNETVIEINNLSNKIIRPIKITEGDFASFLKVKFNPSILGASLTEVNIGWRHEREKTSGIFVMGRLSYNEYRTKFPRALTLPGRVTATFMLTVGDVAHSIPFEIYVEEAPYNADSAVASDDFSALSDAIATIEPPTVTTWTGANSLAGNIVRYPNGFMELHGKINVPYYNEGLLRVVGDFPEAFAQSPTINASKATGNNAAQTLAATDVTVEATRYSVILRIYIATGSTAKFTPDSYHTVYFNIVGRV